MAKKKPSNNDIIEVRGEMMTFGKFTQLVEEMKEQNRLLESMPRTIQTALDRLEQRFRKEGICFDYSLTRCPKKCSCNE